MWEVGWPCWGDVGGARGGGGLGAMRVRHALEGLGERTSHTETARGCVRMAPPGARRDSARPGSLAAHGASLNAPAEPKTTHRPHCVRVNSTTADVTDQTTASFR